ncbi:hypothetical protein [Paraburkholderia fungorum]|nr:hypothetical protein [Paraburkholderia fungorum]
MSEMTDGTGCQSTSTQAARTPNGVYAVMTDVTRKLATWCLAACIAASLAGCAMPSMLSFKGDKVKWDTMTFSASDDVNNNSPVAVDVVFVTDEAMLARIAELPASKWFAGRADLVSTFPKSIGYRSWEFVPGQHLDVPGDTFDRPRVAAAFVFANYAGPGAHRVRIEQFSGRLAVQLDDNTFSISAVK